MLNYNDKNEEHEQETESTPGLDENNSSESFKGTPTSRHRSCSTSSSTSLTSSDDDFNLSDIPVKGKLH